MKKARWIIGAAFLAGLAFLAASGLQTSKCYLTPIGGHAIALANRTGRTTYYGEIVSASSAFSSAFSAVANGYDNFGVSYQSGVTVGGICWVVVGGIADVCMADFSVATIGAMVMPSAGTAGVAISIPAPSPGLPGEDEHFQEIGHYIGTNTAGTNKVARAVLHWN